MMSKQRGSRYLKSPRSEARSASRSQSRERGRHSRSRSFVSRSESSSRSRSRSPKFRYDNSCANVSDHSKYGKRDDPEPSRCLGVFGLSVYTAERDLREMFGKFGSLENVQIVYDHPTGRSRGFGFVYFKNVKDAVEAKERIAGTQVDGHRIRVDYSITKRAHTPTPGIYMGAVDSRRRTYRGRRSVSPYRDFRPRYYDSPKRSYYSRRYDDKRSPYRSRYDGGRHRSPSPRYYRERRHRRSRSHDY